MNKKTDAFRTPLERVLAEMERLQLNNQQFATRLGISKGTWNQWKARRIPSKEYQSVADRLGWSLEKLVAGKDATLEKAHYPLDLEMLRQVIAMVEELLDTHERQMSPEGKAALIAGFYDDSMRRGAVDKTTIENMLNTMMKFMAGSL